MMGLQRRGRASSAAMRLEVSDPAVLQPARVPAGAAARDRRSRRPASARGLSARLDERRGEAPRPSTCSWGRGGRLTRTRPSRSWTRETELAAIGCPPEQAFNGLHDNDPHAFTQRGRRDGIPDARLEDRVLATTSRTARPEAPGGPPSCRTSRPTSFSRRPTLGPTTRRSTPVIVRVPAGTSMLEFQAWLFQATSPVGPTRVNARCSAWRDGWVLLSASTNVVVDVQPTVDGDRTPRDVST